jgi:protein SFI1
VKALNTRRLKRFLRVWTNRLKTRQREKWRQDMRVKLKTVQNKRELRAQKDAWAKWQHLYHLHLAAHRYNEHLAITLFKRWYCRLSRIDRLETHADEAIQHQLQRLVIRGWTHWKRALELSLCRKTFTEQANRRTLESNMLIWRRRTYVNLPPIA